MQHVNAITRADALASATWSETVVEALDRAARTAEGFTFYNQRGLMAERLSYAELREQAIETARGLVQAGLAPGSRMALMAETNADFMLLFFACQYAGVIPVPLPLPLNLGGRDAYEERLKRQIGSAGASAVAASEQLLPFVHQAVMGLNVDLVGTPAEFYNLPNGCGGLRPFSQTDPCYVQYSSGSTRFPKGVTVTQRSLTSNARGIIIHGLRIGGGDRCVSWLPLYHDMGLVGFCLTPLLAELSVDYLATQDFARRPLLWLELMSANGGTISFSPTFGYDLCARRVERTDAAEKFDLSRWRVAGIGGDMIQPNAIQRFASTFAASGFRETAFVPSYGLAEATLAVTFAPLDTGVQVDVVDKQQVTLAHRAVPVKVNGSRNEGARAFVLCGRALPDHQLEIRDEDSGAKLPDRRIGKVYVKGPSVMGGYFGDPTATACILSEDAWLDTGDMGYTVNGSVVITGRSKDLIIVNGRNIWPQDIEWAVEQLPGLRRGDAAAFSGSNGQGSEIVVVVVECRLNDADAREALRRDVVAMIRRTAGVECEVVLAKPRSLPHTSSGKLSRSQAKAHYLAGLFEMPADEQRHPVEPSVPLPSAAAAG